MKVPKRAQVDRAIRGVKLQARSTLRAVNLHAGKLLSRGRYAEAEELMRIGRSIDSFQVRIDDLRTAWREVSASSKSKRAAEERTPLWRFYHPIAKALLNIGGTGTRADLEKALPPFLQGLTTPADMTVGAKGMARWKVMLKRARRPMVKERFLEPVGGAKWVLSADGKRMAQGAPPAEGAK
jgi:hypothetical protein